MEEHQVPKPKGSYKNDSELPGISERGEFLRTALHQAFATHQSFLHPKVLEASQALDKKIVQWLKQSQG